jgi:hypothetical protein
MLAGVILVAGLGAQQSPPPPQGPTFSKDVAPILYKNCTSCHRAGEIAPMPLMTYEEARPYAKSIRDKVATGHMPPWHADPAYGKFKNDRHLTDAEIETLTRWAAIGAPKGDPKDLPPAPKYTDGWNIGTPDAVFTMPESYNVPADGTIEYQYFDVPTNFTEDKWITAVEVRPGNRSVVHHVIVFYTEPDVVSTRTRAIQMGPNMGLPRPAGAPAPAPAPPADPNAPRPAPKPPRMMLAGLAPGTEASVMVPGTALLVRAGSKLTFQMHYTANGVAASDRTSVGVKFAKAAPDTELRVTALINQNFVIPAGEANHTIEANLTLLEDITLWAMLPHTHLRGTSWKYDVTYPDGRKEVILSVPHYDFNWQTEYKFERPLSLPKGTKLHAVATYDNSTKNLSNPDPKSDVKWGDQTWEEMMFTGLTYSVDKDRRNVTGGGGPR